MSVITRNFEKIDVQFEMVDGVFTAAFADPSYVRAETIVYDPAERSLHAVMYDGMFFVSIVPERFRDELADARAVKLTSYLSCGSQVDMMARLSFVEDKEGYEKSTIPGLLPAFAAANDGLRA